MKLRVVSKAPFGIALAEAKLFLRVTHTEEDGLITSMLDAILSQAEVMTNRAFSTTTYELYLDEMKTIELPRAPFVSLDSVELLKDGVYTLFSGYRLDDNGVLAKLIFEESVSCEKENCLKIGFTAGYATLPDDIKNWAYAKLATLYEYRTEFADGGVAKIDNPFLDHILDKYKVRTFV